MLRFLKSGIRRLLHAVYDGYFLASTKLAGVKRRPGRLRAVHVSAFSFGNAGDTLLPLVLRDLFDMMIGIKNWRHIHAHTIITDSMVKKINRRDVLVIGGGGLFLKDTNPNQLSGWQWSCGIEQLEKITAPIVVFALGYNRFRGQDDFDAIFSRHLNLLVEKAVFVGIRNRGSVRKLREYLDSDFLKNKLRFQPCMTTLIAKICGESGIDFTGKEDFIAVNCAFDRASLRFPEDSVLVSLARVVQELSRITRIKYYSHAKSDKKILPYFDNMNINYELVELNKVTEIIDAYRKPRLVIGMRGHAQMIPFGCLTPVLSIVTHDKLGWFLEDVSHPEWGVDVVEADFEAKLRDKAVSLYHHYRECVGEIKKEQEKLWDITVENMEAIHEKL